MQSPEYRPLTIGDWIVTKLILAIPFVGLVMLCVWAFSSDTHPSKKSFCQSALIIAGCIIALAMIGFFIILALGGLAAVLGQHAQPQN